MALLVAQPCPAEPSAKCVFKKRQRPADDRQIVPKQNRADRRHQADEIHASLLNTFDLEGADSAAVTLSSPFNDYSPPDEICKRIKPAFC
jgi:hypothetical protein